MPEYVYQIMMIAAGVLIFFAIKQYNNTQNLLNNGEYAIATVVKFIENSNSDGDDTYKAVFEYHNKHSELISFKDEFSSSPKAYSLGEKIQVVYLEKEKKHKVVSFWGLYRWTILLTCFASPLTIISVGHLFYKLFWVPV